MRVRPVFLMLGLLALTPAVWAEQDPDEAAPDDAATTVEQPAPDQARRREFEKSIRDNPYAITPHRANFLLPLSYSHRPNGQPFGVADKRLNQLEVKFQLSFKVAIWEEILGLPLDLHFAYTGRSFWQAYNSVESAPFRDTNHEPEAFITTLTDWQLGPVKRINLRAGFSHQSNGQRVELSRSWNRLYAGASGHWRNFFADAVLWHRLPEDPKDGPDDPKGDDNPDIEDFVGRGAFTLAWAIDGKTVNLNWRSNLRPADHRGALTAAFTYPLTRKLKGYVEFFAGYGETLIDYDQTNERLSLGIALSDWL